MKKFALVTLVILVALSAKGQGMFTNVFVEAGGQSSYFRHSATAGLHVEGRFPYGKGRLPYFFRAGLDSTANSPKERIKDFLHLCIPTFWMFGANAEYFFLENNWLIDISGGSSYKLRKEGRYSLHPGRYSRLWNVWLHYRFSPDFKHHYLCPEVAKGFYRLWIGLSYYIPITHREPWYSNFFLSLKFKIPFKREGDKL